MRHPFLYRRIRQNDDIDHTLVQRPLHLLTVVDQGGIAIVLPGLASSAATTAIQGPSLQPMADETSIRAGRRSCAATARKPSRVCR